MPRLEFAPAAQTDFRDIMHYIARDNPQRALSFVDDIEKACWLWAETPQAGRDCSYLREGLRSFPHGNYVVFYRPRADGIFVVRIVHAARDHRRIL